MRNIFLLLIIPFALISCKTTEESQKSDIKTESNKEFDTPLGLVQKAVNIDELVQKKLYWIQTIYNDGTIIAPTEKKAYVIFESKHVLKVQTDCNFGTGTYSVENKTIKLSILRLTKMACPETTESEFLKDLREATIVFTQGNKIFFDLKYDSGTMEFEIKE